VALLATTVFLSTFLLFQVQPIIGKYILPWFGSTSGVWATALMFFQLMLLGGYAYAHFIVSRLTWRRQALLHAVLLGLALIVLPITPSDGLKPTSADASVARTLFILLASVGAPYLLLSATAPLIQRWFAHLHPGRSPYRLYALSNLGSLLALLSNPFLVEPYVRLQSQTLYWPLGYVVFGALGAGCAWMLYRSLGGVGVGLSEPGAEAGRVDDSLTSRPPSWRGCGVSVAIAVGVWIRPASRDHQPDVDGRRGGAVPVDSPALRLLADIYSDVRPRALVCASRLYRRNPGGPHQRCAAALRWCRS
jgi:hypothetical protein